jgi:heme/copper-type cytochrome/quinol oxidase subunit 2
MSCGEREAITGLITCFLVLVLFFWRLSGQHEAGLFAGPEALQTWARSVLVLIAWSIGIAIAVAIGFHIAYEAMTGEKTDDRRDERDHDIDRRSLTWAWHLLSFGLLGVIVRLAFGDTAFSAMNMVLALCLVSEMFRDGAKLILYRRSA